LLKSGKDAVVSSVDQGAVVRLRAMSTRSVFLAEMALGEFEIVLLETHSTKVGPRISN
jgi:hypothetical protein